jgi:hypothetical protein
MITPAYSPTATERVLPRLALDFTTGVLDSRVTVTRLLNTATRINASGFIETVNANLPRFDYNPVTLAPRGLLIEEQRINLLLRSAEFENAAWTKSNASITANAEISPDGTVNADKLVENTANSTHRTFNNIAVTITAGAVISYSIFAKAAERTSVRITDNDLAGATFNLSNGTITSTDAGVTSTITAFPNGWHRCTVACATATANGRISVAIVSGGSTTYTGDGTSGIYIYGAQLEAGAFATSYIPTTTTSLTRNADDVSMTGTNFSSWYNQSEGTFQVEASATIPSSGSQTFIAVSDNTPSNYIGPYMLNSLGYVYHKIVTLGANECEFAAAIGVTNNSIFKYAFCYKQNSAQIAVNTVLGAGDTSVNVPTVTLAEIGSRASSSRMNGHMRKILYWPQRLLDRENQAFSK